MKTQTTNLKRPFAKTLSTLAMALFLGLWTQSTQAQTPQIQTSERTVSGVVQSTHGPIPFAAISLKGSQVGIQADETGAFTFPQPLKENDVLIISSLAYEDQEFKIKGTSSFIEPFLEGTEIIIVGALRTQPSTPSKTID